IPDSTPADVDAAVGRAKSVFSSWESVAASARSVILVRAAGIVRARADTLAALLSAEQGKPIREARDEVQGAAHVFEYYASVCGSIPGDARRLPKYGYLNVVRKPMGICGAVIPWNMPVIIFAWKAGGALACGNCVLVKPSCTAPLTVDAIAKIFEEAGLPPHVLQVVHGRGSTAGDAVVRHPDIRHVSFTGSMETGRSIAQTAAPYLKKLVLELGGNDAFIVTETADLKSAVANAVRNRFYNCGQVCTSPKRILVHESLADTFVKMAAEKIAALKVGCGADGADVGPLNNPDQAEIVENAVSDIVGSAKGTLVCGGTRTAGNFYLPTLMKDVEPSAVSKELFGPVMPVIPFSAIEEAVKIANATPYGLGGSVWTADLKTARRVAEELDAGIVWVNKHLILPPELPFGGVGGSGYGRENGREFYQEYTYEKSILMG
ncbi:MAG TPA: aldehyde dehydrogenase family protein, partial [Methanocorpusculum sp.]|nr:aldehyde dehydrogenase family protein [Methanocorpusculum sp.]